MELHVVGIVRDRSLSSFNQVDQEKVRLRVLVAARRSPPQPALGWALLSE